MRGISALAAPDTGNTGPDERLGANGHPVNRVPAVSQKSGGTGTQNLNPEPADLSSAAGLIKRLGYRKVSEKPNDETATPKENME
jgi:hypothetical protein